MSYTIAAIATLGALTVAACVVPTPNRQLHAEEANGTAVFQIRDYRTKSMHILLDLDSVGDVGPLHPTVIEAMLASPASPIVTWFDVLLTTSLDVPHDPATNVAFSRARQVLDRLAAEARVIAGARAPTATDFARAYARRVAPQIGRALATSHKPSYPGVVQVTCCGTVDHRLWRIEPRMQSELVLLIARSAQSRMVRLVWMDKTQRGDLAWDVRGLPAALSGDGPLDYLQAVDALVPLHREDGE